MISKKENLLIRPWQQRKYEHHKRKVLSALPVVDTKSPPHRGHVTVKLKKLQRENERSEKIEKDNHLLLQKLNYIMKTHWLDNWLPPQPSFLSRICVYRLEESIISNEKSTDVVDVKERSLRKSKCQACSGQKLTEIKQIPEERIPWEPEKRQMRRNRSKSVPLRKFEPPPPIFEPVMKPNPAKKIRSKSGPYKNTPNAFLSSDFMIKEPQSITLSRGCLKLSVNFPSDTSIKLQKGNIEKYICKEICNCKKSMPLVLTEVCQ